MARTVKLGAPSLTGKDANDLVASEFSGVKYPLKVLVTNHMPRNVVFPEVHGLFLSHTSSVSGSSMTVEISNAAQFQRLASSIEQIAELNGYELALTIEEVPVVAATKVKSADTATTK